MLPLILRFGIIPDNFNMFNMLAAILGTAHPTKSHAVAGESHTSTGSGVERVTRSRSSGKGPPLSRQLRGLKTQAVPGVAGGIPEHGCQ
jgi:hypothetical protein